MGLFDFLFRNRNNDIQEFRNRGAVILDVRTKKEYDNGHIKGARHIPLQQVSSKIEEIKSWDKPVITCCLSGGRSGQAAKILKQHAIEATNGGGWASLDKKL